jgi:hypothetical protein
MKNTDVINAFLSEKQSICIDSTDKYKTKHLHFHIYEYEPFMSCICSYNETICIRENNTIYLFDRCKTTLGGRKNQNYIDAWGGIDKDLIEYFSQTTSTHCKAIHRTAGEKHFNIKLIYYSCEWKELHKTKIGIPYLKEEEEEED